MSHILERIMKIKESIIISVNKFSNYLIKACPRCTARKCNTHQEQTYNRGRIGHNERDNVQHKRPVEKSFSQPEFNSK